MKTGEKKTTARFLTAIGVFAATAILVLSLSASCSPDVFGPFQPCPEISKEEHDAALAKGAALMEANIYADGTISYVGPGGFSQCKKSGGFQVCRRRKDMVIRYTFADGTQRYASVPAGISYRLNVNAKPLSCEREPSPGG